MINNVDKSIFTRKRSATRVEQNDFFLSCWSLLKLFELGRSLRPGFYIENSEVLFYTTNKKTWFSFDFIIKSVYFVKYQASEAKAPLEIK